MFRYPFEFDGKEVDGDFFIDRWYYHCEHLHELQDDFVFLLLIYAHTSDTEILISNADEECSTLSVQEANNGLK